MKIENLAKLSKKEFAKIKNDLAKLKTLGQVLTWTSAGQKGDFLPQIVAETITQDERTIDVIIPLRICFLSSIRPDLVRLRQLPFGKITDSR